MISDNNNNIIIAIVIAKHLLRPYYMLGSILNVLNPYNIVLYGIRHYLQVKEIGPHLKTCPKVHNWKVSELPFRLRQSGSRIHAPHSIDCPVLKHLQPAGLAWTGTHHSPEETSDMRPEMQMSIDTARFHRDSLKVSAPIASWIISVTTQRGNLHRDGTTMTWAILAHTQEQLKLRCLTAWTSREMQIKTTTW